MQVTVGWPKVPDGGIDFKIHRMTFPSSSEGAQSIARAALLMRTLATFGAQGAALMQISALTQLPKATVHRMLAALLQEQLVERPWGTRKYRLGPQVYAYGLAVRDVFDLKAMAQPCFERLAHVTGETVYLGIRCGYDAVCLDKRQGNLPQNAEFLQVNDRWPMGIGSFSLAILAYLSDEEIADILAFNRLREGDDKTYSKISSSIQKIRKNGYALTKTRSVRGISGVAVPVFDRRHYPIGSLCAVSTQARMTGAYMSGLVTTLKQEAEILSAQYELARLNPTQAETWRSAIHEAQAPRVAY
jgi:DNA-binding IclR family transcriptional regulator